MSCTIALWAQPKDNSPLSRFGLGDVWPDNFATVSSMGGIGSAYHHIYQGNISNPASYGWLEATAFETSLFAKTTTLKREGLSENVWSGNLEYFSLSIPMINPINELLERKDNEFSWGLNISLLPYSQVGYFVLSEDQVDSIGMVSREFLGQGSTNRFNVGNGWKYKNFAFGVNLSYLFGQNSYQTETIFNDLVNNFEHIDRDDISLRGFFWNMGAQYDIDLADSQRQNNRRLTLGVTYNPSTTFTTKSDHVNFVQNPFFNVTDTAEFSLNAQGDGTLPGRIGFGLRFEETTRFSVGIDYARTTWSDYVNDARPETMSDTWRLGLGGSYTPDFSSISSYFQRVEYRAGLFYETDPRSLSGEQVKQYGITAGMGMPFVFQRFFSFVNLGLEYGRRGTKDSLKENYLRFRLGFTLNDNQWFLKRRYN